MSYAVLDSLITAGATITGLVFLDRLGSRRPIQEVHPASSWSRTEDSLPVLQAKKATSLADFSARYRFPIFHVTSLNHPETLRRFAELEPDLFGIACFEARLPQILLRLPGLGALNVHPSLLPALRGPDPLFWAYRLLLKQTGVTVHRVTSQLDAGQIIRQQVVPIPEQLPGDQLENEVSSLGAELLVESIDAIRHGQQSPIEQDQAEATYYTWPRSKDLLIDPNEWRMREAGHFIAGVIPLGYQPRIAVPGGIHPVQSISAVQSNKITTAGMAIQFWDGTAQVQFGTVSRGQC